MLPTTVEAVALPVGGRRTPTVPASEIVALRVKSQTFWSKNSLGQPEATEALQLLVDRRSRVAVALELFADVGHAEVRRQQITAILRRPTG